MILPVYVLSVGIVAHAENFRFFGIVDVQRELAVRHYPIELRVYTAFYTYYEHSGFKGA